MLVGNITNTSVHPDSVAYLRWRRMADFLTFILALMVGCVSCWPPSSNIFSFSRCLRYPPLLALRVITWRPRTREVVWEYVSSATEKEEKEAASKLKKKQEQMEIANAIEVGGPNRFRGDISKKISVHLVSGISHVKFGVIIQAWGRLSCCYRSTLCVYAFVRTPRMICC